MSWWRVERSRPLAPESSCSAMARLRRTVAGRPSSPWNARPWLRLTGLGFPSPRSTKRGHSGVKSSLGRRARALTPALGLDRGWVGGGLLSATLEVPSGKSRSLDPCARHGRQPMVSWMGVAAEGPISGSLGAAEAAVPEAVSAASSTSAAGASGWSSAPATAAGETRGEAAAQRRRWREACFVYFPRNPFSPPTVYGLSKPPLSTNSNSIPHPSLRPAPPKLPPRAQPTIGSRSYLPSSPLLFRL